MDAFVDSRLLIGAWEGEGSKKSPELTRATKDLFFVLSAHNMQLNLIYVPLAQNMADGPSCQLSTILANNVGTRLFLETFSINVFQTPLPPAQC